MKQLADAQPRDRVGVFLSTLAAILMAATVIRPHFAPVALIALAATGLAVRRQGFWEDVRGTAPGPALLLAAAFCTFAAVSAAWSLDPAHSLKVGITMLATLAGALALPRLFNRMPDALRQRLLFGTLAGYTIGVFLMAIEFIADFPITKAVVTIAPHLAEEWGGTSYIDIINGEIFVRTGLFSRTMFPIAVLLFPVLFVAAMRTSGRRRQVYLYVPILCALVIVPLAGKTAAQLSLILGLLIYLIAYKSTKWAHRLVTAGWIATIVLIVPACLLASRFTFDTTDFKSSHYSSRLQIWSHIGPAYLNNPVLGVGADAMRVAERKRVAALPEPTPEATHPDTRDLRYIPRRHPHNSFLQVWFELGAIGAGLLLAAGLAAITLLRGLPERAKPFALAGTAVAIVYVTVAHSFWQPWFAATLALAFIICRLADDPPETG